MFHRNVRLGPALKITKWRQLSLGVWRAAADPSIYAVIECDARNALKYLESHRSKSNDRFTLTHFVTKAIAETYSRLPDLNVVIRWGKIYPRTSIDIGVLVAPDQKGNDLTAITIRDADHKSLEMIAQETEKTIRPIKEKGDRAFSLAKTLLTLFPGFLARPLVLLLEYVIYGFNIHSKVFGLPRDPFGGVILTNVGSLGIDYAFAPLVPMSRVPLMISLTALKDKPVAIDGKVEAIPVITLCFTVDHRVIDGVHGSRIASTLRSIIENPQTEF